MNIYTALKAGMIFYLPNSIQFHPLSIIQKVCELYAINIHTVIKPFQINRSFGFRQYLNSEKCICRLRNIAMRDYQESVTTGQTDTQRDGQKDAGQSDPDVPLCLAGDTKIAFRTYISVSL